MDAWLTWLLGHLTNAGLSLLIVAVVLVIFFLTIEAAGKVLFRLLKK